MQHIFKRLSFGKREELFRLAQDVGKRRCWQKKILAQEAHEYIWLRCMSQYLNFGSSDICGEGK